MNNSGHFSTALEQARAEHKPVMALRRHHDGTMDDVVGKDVETVHAEQLSEGSLWMAWTFRNGERVTFHIHANRKNDLSYDVGELPEGGWLDMDDNLRERGEAA